MLFKDQMRMTGPLIFKPVECQGIYWPGGRVLEWLIRPGLAGTTALAYIQGYQPALFDVKRPVLAGFPPMMAMAAQGFTLVLVSHFRFFERNDICHEKQLPWVSGPCRMVQW
jgi:hypothetical protein